VKKALIITAIIIFIIVASGFFLLAPAPATAALLYVNAGQVDVNTGEGWSIASDEMELAQGAQIRTQEGEATVVLLEGEVISLEPNTHISLDVIRSNEIEISQLAGDTWNKVSKITGISDYTVTTPTTVATVRGTEFFLRQLDLLVGDGTVEYSNINTPHNSLRVREGQKANANRMVEEPMTDEERALFAKWRENYVEILKRVRLREIRKHQTLLNMAKERGVSEDKIMQWLDEVDRGVRSEDELFHKVPVLLRAKAERTYELTKLIKQGMRELNEI